MSPFKKFSFKFYQKVVEEPIILFIKGIKPQRVLFIHSEETEEYLDIIQQWTGLSLTQVEKKIVNSSDPVQ